MHAECRASLFLWDKFLRDATARAQPNNQQPHAVRRRPHSSEGRRPLSTPKSSWRCWALRRSTTSMNSKRLISRRSGWPQNSHGSDRSSSASSCRGARRAPACPRGVPQERQAALAGAVVRGPARINIRSAAASRRRLSWRGAANASVGLFLEAGGATLRAARRAQGRNTADPCRDEEQPKSFASLLSFFVDSSRHNNTDENVHQYSGHGGGRRAVAEWLHAFELVDLAK